MVADIVMKLMAKNPEDRYQSALGLNADLQRCWQQWQERGDVGDFPLGEQDICDIFIIPDKIYGRETELKQLLAGFKKTATSSSNHPPIPSHLLLIAGYSGIGKSSLINQFRHSIALQPHYFISGKFEQFQRNVPYSGIVSALRVLVKQLLSEPEEELQKWRIRLRESLGTLGQVIIEAIPEVELIIGLQPPVTKLEATESQNRFHFVFSKFIQTFCSSQKPLVIFLDDLQWSDSASLKLMQLMLREGDQGLVLMGAYRDNEVSSTHPLLLTLEDIKKQGSIVTQMTLTPLNLEHIEQLIADTLHHTPTAVQPLAELVLRKTAGNPFFVREFLKTLYEENLITFAYPQSSLNSGEARGRKWQWDLGEIDRRNITDNVVELTLTKIKKLPRLTQQILCIAACLGTNFDLNILAMLCDQPLLQVKENLEIAVRADLIYALGQLNYKFPHDRIQQAAYGLMEEKERQAVHLKIGRQLGQNVEGERLFKAVEHLNVGSVLVTETKEKIDIAKLNLLAGYKAATATAYEAAF